MKKAIVQKNSLYFLLIKNQKPDLRLTGTSPGIWNGLGGMTQNYQMVNSLLLSLSKPFFDYMLLEHDKLPCFLPLAVHLE